MVLVVVPLILVRVPVVLSLGSYQVTAVQLQLLQAPVYLQHVGQVDAAGLPDLISRQPEGEQAAVTLGTEGGAGLIGIKTCFMLVIH